MPVAARHGARRRTTLGPRFGYGVHAAQYRFVERWDGVRVEHPLRHVVDLRVDGWRVEIASETRRAHGSLFAAPVQLARLLAGMLLDLPNTARGTDFDAIRREAWTIGQALLPVRRRLFDRHAPEASAVEERMVQLRGDVPRLARAPLFYRTPYLARDVRRFRAAAVALAFLEDELLPAAVDGRSPGIPALRRTMLNWRGLFAPDGVAYPSLDRTLMNLPAGIPPALLCALRHVRLERPVVDPLELHLLLQCVDVARRRGRPLPWLHALQHAPAASLRDGLARIAAATQRTAFDPLDASDMEFVATYLLDAQCGAATRFQHVVSHALYRHGLLRHRPPLDDAFARILRQLGLPAQAPSIATPTARPPLPPPSVAGLRFLATVGEVMDEGRRMGHCIGLYVDRAVSGDCFLFHAERGGESASIEVGAEGRVRQAAGRHNRRNATCEWATRQLECWIARWPPTRDDGA